jgi:hypothetical protein
MQSTEYWLGFGAHWLPPNPVQPQIHRRFTTRRNMRLFKLFPFSHTWSSASSLIWQFTPSDVFPDLYIDITQVELHHAACTNVRHGPIHHDRVSASNYRSRVPGDQKFGRNLASRHVFMHHRVARMVRSPATHCSTASHCSTVRHFG